MKLLKLMTASAALSAAVSIAQAEELTFANFTAPTHTVTDSLIASLQTAVSEASGGDVTVRAYHGGELGAGPVEQYVRGVQGVADFVWGLPGYTSSQFETTMIVELPDAIPLDAPGYAALWAAFDEHLADEFPGTVPIALWTSEPSIIIMKEKVVRVPSDLEGLKIRVAGATAAEVAEALGATPVQMPINQVYNALQTGLIDGVITGSSTLNDFKLDEVASSYTLGANLGRLTFFAAMNESAYNDLDDAVKAAMDPRAFSKVAEDAWRATADLSVEQARARGDNTFIDLTPEGAAAFSAAIAGVVDAYVDRVDGADALAAMRSQ